MANEKPTTIVAIQGPKSPNHHEVYTNISKVGIGPWDMRLIFGHLIEGATPNQQVMEDLVTVVMSPQHAKVLLSGWQTAMKAYEDNFGAIPDLTEKITALVGKETH
jgi:hypothetical protein